MSCLLPVCITLFAIAVLLFTTKGDTSSWQYCIVSSNAVLHCTLRDFILLLDCFKAATSVAARSPEPWVEELGTWYLSAIDREGA